MVSAARRLPAPDPAGEKATEGVEERAGRVKAAWTRRLQPRLAAQRRGFVHRGGGDERRGARDGGGLFVSMEARAGEERGGAGRPWILAGRRCLGGRSWRPRRAEATLAGEEGGGVFFTLA